MAVERESMRKPMCSGVWSLQRLYRGPNGQWSMEIDLDITAYLSDGRRVRLHKTINTTATQQLGRRRRSENGGDEHV